MVRDETIAKMLGTSVSRRVVLQGTAVAGATAFLAACGGGGEGSPSGGGEASPSGGGGEGGTLNFANWPAYIDLTEDETSSPTLTAFEAEYGVEVNYVEDIQSNEDFYATVAPQLEAGLPTGWDLIVLTDYMAARLVKAGWVEEIDQASVPVANANLREALRNRSWDPEQKFAWPWQSGADGIGYNRVSTGRDLTSLEDMFDPAFSGHVTMLTGYTDTFSMIDLLLLKKGEVTNVPAEMTEADGDKIFAFLKPYVDSTHIRGFTGNEYIQGFASGDVWVALVYSGDLASSGGPDDNFVYPTEGALIWTDNMLIPKGAEHRDLALKMIDWVYDVGRAAALANYIYYISPVHGVDEAIVALDPEAATNPLLFPPPDVVARMYEQPAFEGEKNQYFEDLSATLEGA